MSLLTSWILTKKKPSKTQILHIAFLSALELKIQKLLKVILEKSAGKDAKTLKDPMLVAQSFTLKEGDKPIAHDTESSKLCRPTMQTHRRTMNVS